jgi:hypothetical protein
MNETSRTQGWAICGGAALAAAVFLIGVMNGSYWAIAIPVTILTLFALGLVGWVGFTIASIQVDSDVAPDVVTGDRPDVAKATGSGAEDAA